MHGLLHFGLCMHRLVHFGMWGALLVHFGLCGHLLVDFGLRVALLVPFGAPLAYFASVWIMHASLGSRLCSACIFCFILGSGLSKVLLFKALWDQACHNYCYLQHFGLKLARSNAIYSTLGSGLPYILIFTSL